MKDSISTDRLQRVHSSRLVALATAPFIAVALTVVVPVAVMAQQSNSTTSSAAAKDSATAVAPADKAFLEEAAAGGMAEVQMGELAERNAESADVRQFGERMVKDHGKVNDQLKSLAQAKGVSLPSSPNAEAKSEMKKLEALKGNAFDRSYAKHMVKDHKKDVAAFEKASKSAKDVDIKRFATEALPTLKSHLERIEAIEQKLS